MQPYYDRDGITIYCGDAREIVPNLTGIDLILTDPPYGVTQNDWDTTEAVFDVFDRRLAPMVCTAQNPFSAQLICRYADWFKWADVWEKTQATGFLNAKVMPLRKHEDILVFCRGRMTYNPQISKKPRADIRPHHQGNRTSNYGAFASDRIRTVALDESYPTSIVTFPNAQDGLHPTQKPLALFRYLMLTYSNPGDVILDPFGGSGTTARAAKDLGRRCILIEREERYCKIAVQRLSQQVLPLDIPA